MNEAIGIIEMFGFVTAITAADAAAKAADVKIIAIDSNKPANAENRISVGRDRVGHIPNNA